VAKTIARPAAPWPRSFPEWDPILASDKEGWSKGDSSQDWHGHAEAGQHSMMEPADHSRLEEDFLADHSPIRHDDEQMSWGARDLPNVPVATSSGSNDIAGRHQARRPPGLSSGVPDLTSSDGGRIRLGGEATQGGETHGVLDMGWR